MNFATFALFTAAGLLAAGPLHAEDQNSEIITVGADKFLRWQSQVGRTYFVQVSDPNAPLRKWIWAPTIETGHGQEISYEVDGTATKGFFRLRYTDQVPGPNETPETADFDGDGLSNWHEITLSQSDPLEVDTDGDSLPDGWEWLSGLDLLDGTGENGAQGDPDHDGVINEEQHAHQTDPGTSDTDGDGITDGGELDQNTDPNDPSHKPEAEWFILTGDLGQDILKTRTRLVTIPAGETRVIAVAVASDEYPDWTLDASEYNDTLAWNIHPAGGQTLADSIDVNSRHLEWEEEDLAGFGIQGHYPAYLEASAVVKASDDCPLVVQLVLSATNIGDGGFESTVMVGVLPARIVPDDGQPGKTGDQIPSVNGEAGEKHFVSPKKTAEIPDDFMDLKVVGVVQPLFERLLEWEGGEIYPGEPLKCRVKRELPLQEVVKIRAQYDDAEADVMNVWIVWTSAAHRLGTVVPLPHPEWFEYRIDAGEDNIWKFQFTILPAEIVAPDAERPDLGGLAHSQRPVPGHEKSWPNVSDPLLKADTATFKWDVSRQMSVTLRNPGLIPKQSLEEHFLGQWTDEQPQVIHTPVPFPANPVEGNDDPYPEDEENDPYQVSNRVGLQHGIGQLASFDFPGWAVLNSWGTVNNQEFVAMINFKEFVRLQLYDGIRANGDCWFRISDYTLWHHSLKAKFNLATGKWIDGGSWKYSTIAP